MDWDRLFSLAESRIKAVCKSFPDPLKAEVEAVPCILEKWPHEDLEADILGYYPAFEDGRLGEEKGPIFLFLGSIQASCEVLGTDFSDEVEKTFLHELGHHLGLDEEELRERDLD